MRVLLTRPLRESLQLAHILSLCGHEGIVSPVLEIVPVAWGLPAAEIDAVVLTSQNAVPETHLDILKNIPCFCIGDATATAARAAGLTVASQAGGDRCALVAEIAAANPAQVLFLSGHQERADLIAELAAAHITATKRIVYRAVPLPEFSPEASQALQQNAIDWVVLYSPRSARLFCGLLAQVPMAGAPEFQLACLSEAVAGAWRAVPGASGASSLVVANTPSTQALLAAARLLCDSAMEYVKDQS
jgi:uroporphyrinogen-III synthase